MGKISFHAVITFTTLFLFMCFFCLFICKNLGLVFFFKFSIWQWLKYWGSHLGGPVPTILLVFFFVYQVSLRIVWVQHFMLIRIKSIHWNLPKLKLLGTNFYVWNRQVQWNTCFPTSCDVRHKFMVPKCFC
jgi:hypothetical protein